MKTIKEVYVLLINDTKEVIQYLFNLGRSRPPKRRIRVAYEIHPSVYVYYDTFSDFCYQPNVSTESGNTFGKELSYIGVRSSCKKQFTLSKTKIDVFFKTIVSLFNIVVFNLK